LPQAGESPPARLLHREGDEFRQRVLGAAGRVVLAGRLRQGRRGDRQRAAGAGTGRRHRAREEREVDLGARR